MFIGSGCYIFAFCSNKGTGRAGKCERFHMRNNHIKDANVLFASSSKECMCMCSSCACQPVISRSMPPPLYFGHDKYHPKHTALSTLWKTLKPCFWLIKASLKLSKALQDFKQEVTLKNSVIPIQTTQSESWNSQYLYVEKSCSCFIECQKSTKAKQKAKQSCSSMELYSGSDVSWSCNGEYMRVHEAQKCQCILWSHWSEKFELSHCITSIEMWLFLSYIQDWLNVLGVRPKHC